ncbi:MAG: dihydroxy-acid dehydratase [Alphaproteobacteria bacterium]
MGDGRQSGTSGITLYTQCFPESAAGGNLALLETGDKIQIDHNKGRADILISDTRACFTAYPL